MDGSPLGNSSAILLGGKDLKPRRQDEKTEHIHCALHTLVVKNEFFSETSFIWKTILKIEFRKFELACLIELNNNSIAN